jgi:restriction endonuclease S subunit
MKAWREYSLGQLLSYEQPTPYIVASANYDDNFETPVLTAGKSFIIGYTNEPNGIYDKLPVIIFDDFTTSTQFVNFPFKVKSSAMKILTANTDLVLPKFIFYRMQLIVCDHSTHKRYWIQQYSKIRIAIPSLPEQKRIVAKIEELFSELDNGVETLKKTKQQLSVYRQAVLKNAFEGIEKFVELGKLAERVFDGPFGTHLKTADYVGKGIRVVRLENIKHAAFDDSKKSFVTEQKYETIKAHTVFPSDLIMSTFIADIIKVCQLPPHIPFAVNKADCIGIRLKNSVSPKFVLFYLSSRGAYEKLSHKVHGATRPRVNTTQIKAIEIPMVAYNQQLSIVSEIESHLSVCDSIEKTVDAALRQAEAMRQSILKKAFEGSL